MDTFADTDDIMLMGTGPGEHWVGPEEIKDAKSTEQTLAAAGFRVKVAQTLRQQTKLAGLPQRTLTRTVGPKGNVRFFWADAADCNCLCAGDEAAYDGYQKISVKKQIAEENEMGADMMDWDAWGVGVPCGRTRSRAVPCPHGSA